MKLTRVQLLELAIEKGMDIKDEQIRRYITIGLLPREKVGKGYAKGLDTFFDETSLEALRKITQIRNNPHIKKESELIYPLFAMGYPVDLHDLIEDFQKQSHEVWQGMETLAQNLEDGDWASWFIEDMAKNSLPPLKPGKPSNAVLQERQEQVEADIALMQVMFGILSAFMGWQIVPGKMIVQLGQQSNNRELDVETAEQVAGWLERERWTENLNDSSESDFAVIQKVFVRLQEYINVLAEVRMPAVQRLAEHFKRSLGELRLIELPRFTKLIILILLEPTWRNSIFDFLMKEEVYQAWYEMCSEFNKKAEIEEE